MSTYTVIFLEPDGSLHSQIVLERPCDDDAIDSVGESTYPHAIDLYDGERHVVRFPPWPRG